MCTRVARVLGNFTFFLFSVVARPDGALRKHRQAAVRTLNVPIIFGNLDTFIAPIWYHRPKLLIFSSLRTMVLILCVIALRLVVASWLLTKSSVSRHITSRLLYVSIRLCPTKCMFIFHRIAYNFTLLFGDSGWLVKGGRCSFGRQNRRSPLWKIFNQSFHAQFIDVNGFYVELMIDIWLLLLM